MRKENAMRMRLFSLLVCAPILACDEDPSGANEEAIDCGPDVAHVDVAVMTTSSDVVFDWSPRCRVAILLVEEGAHDMWAVGDEDANLIEPPVTYGSAPAGLEAYGPEALVDGTEYDLVLWITDPSGDRLVANHQFIR
jgi:hypothetical protein